MDGAHALDQTALRVVRADDLVVLEEVRRHRHQRLLRPRLEPVDGAAADQAREFERAGPELLSDLIL